MKDLMLDLVTHDFIVESLDIGIVDGEDQVRQSLKIRLLFFLGEWFLNTGAGVPYYQEIFVKGTPLNRVEAILREEIKKTPEVISIEEFRLVRLANRGLQVDFRVRTIYGEIEIVEEIGA